jgi:hypothetical protein
VAAVVPGFLDLRLGLGAQLTLRAGGALAVFIIVYFYSPARWVNETPPPPGAPMIKQHTEGSNSPTTVGSGNTVNSAPPRSP